MGPGSMAFGLGQWPQQTTTASGQEPISPAGSSEAEDPQSDQQQFPMLVMLITQWTHLAPFSQSSGLLLLWQLCRLALGPDAPFGGVGHDSPSWWAMHRPQSSKIQGRVVRTQTVLASRAPPALHPDSSG